MASILPFPDHELSTSVTIGVAPSGKPIRVTQKELCSGTYILGVQNSGKSSLLEHLAYQQIKQNECVIIFDPKNGDLIRNAIARIEEQHLHKVRLLDIADIEHPLSFNPFSCKDPESKIERLRTKNSALRAFERIWSDVADQLYFTLLLPHVAEVLIEFPELTMKQVDDILFESDFRAPYVHRLKDGDTKEFWAKRYKRLRQDFSLSLSSRINKLLTDPILQPILCQKESGADTRKIDFAQAIENGDIILINLPLDVEEFKLAAPIMGAFLLSAIYEAVFSFWNIPEDERPETTIIIDEYDSFATAAYSRFFTKGRAQKVKQILAHQHRGQIADALGTNKQATLSAHTIIAMKTTPEDAKEARGIKNKFAGLKRRPDQNSIHIDVLDRMKRYEGNSLVKEFYWHSVTPIQDATKMKIGTEEDDYGRKHDVLPQADFGFGEVSFDPGGAQVALDLLNDLLYYSQKEGEVDALRLQAFLKAYGKLNGVVCRADPDDAADMERLIQNREATLSLLQEKLDPLQRALRAAAQEEEMAGRRRREEYLKQLEKAIERCDQEERLIATQLSDQVARLKHEWEEELKRAFSVHELEVLETCDNALQQHESGILSFGKPLDEHGDYLNSMPLNLYPPAEQARAYKTYVEEKLRFVSWWKKHSDPQWQLAHNTPLWNDYVRLAGKREELGFFATQCRREEAERSLNKRRGGNSEYAARKKHIKNDYERKRKEDESTEEARALSTKHHQLQEEVATLQRNIRELEQTVSQLKQEREFIGHMDRLLTPVLTALITDPIASDKGEAAVEDLLIKLPPRFALAAVGDRIFEMETVDLNQVYTPEDRLGAIYDERIVHIRKVSQEKYCRPLRQVEHELYALSGREGEEEEDQEDSPQSKRSRDEHTISRQPEPEPEQDNGDDDDRWLYEGR